MKIVVLFFVVVGAVAWFLLGGRTISEEQVREFYRRQSTATIERNSDALCGQLDKEFQSTGMLFIAGRRITQELNRAQVCESLTQMNANWDKLADQLGSAFQLDYSYKIHSITLSPDRKFATVDVSETFTVGNSISTIRSRNQEVLISRAGKTLMWRSQSTGSVSAGAE